MQRRRDGKKRRANRSQHSRITYLHTSFRNPSHQRRPAKAQQDSGEFMRCRFWLRPAFSFLAEGSRGRRDGALSARDVSLTDPARYSNGQLDPDAFSSSQYESDGDHGAAGWRAPLEPLWTAPEALLDVAAGDTAAA